MRELACAPVHAAPAWARPGRAEVMFRAFFPRKSRLGKTDDWKVCFRGGLVRRRQSSTARQKRLGEGFMLLRIFVAIS